jgi:hypothetical protein
MDGDAAAVTLDDLVDAVALVPEAAAADEDLGIFFVELKTANSEKVLTGMI